MNCGRWLGLGLLATSVVALGACGTTSVDGGSTATVTTTTTTTTGAGGATSTGAGGAGGATQTTSSGTTTPCGDHTCAATEACVAVDHPPECVDMPEDAGACPDGTTPGDCGGGAGTWPCCCAPPPAPEYHCAPSTCVGEPSCQCVDAQCPEGLMCENVLGTPAVHCIDPPKP